MKIEVISKGLSKWIRQKFQTYRSYNDALKSLQTFSQTMKDFKGLKIISFKNDSKVTLHKILNFVQRSEPAFSHPTQSIASSNPISNCTQLDQSSFNTTIKASGEHFEIFTKPESNSRYGTVVKPCSVSKSAKLKNLEIFEDESESPQNMTLFSSPKTSTQIDHGKKSSKNEILKMSDSPITNRRKISRDLKATNNEALKNSPFF